MVSTFFCTINNLATNTYILAYVCFSVLYILELTLIDKAHSILKVLIHTIYLYSFLTSDKQKYLIPTLSPTIFVYFCCVGI
jgi:hypothetical protein